MEPNKGGKYYRILLFLLIIYNYCRGSFSWPKTLPCRSCFNTYLPMERDFVWGGAYFPPPPPYYFYQGLKHYPSGISCQIRGHLPILPFIIFFWHIVPFWVGSNDGDFCGNIIPFAYAFYMYTIFYGDKNSGTKTEKDPLMPFCPT